MKILSPWEFSLFSYLLMMLLLDDCSTMNLTFSGRSRWRKSDFVWINKHLLATYFSKRDTSITTIFCFIIVWKKIATQKVEVPIFHSKVYLTVL